jgi:hypothetical protein
MSGTARRRESKGRFFKSEPFTTEDPEDLKDDPKEYEDESTSPRREDGAASSILTSNTA